MEKKKFVDSAKVNKELNVKVSELTEEQKRKLIDRHRKKLLEEVLLIQLCMFTLIELRCLPSKNINNTNGNYELFILSISLGDLKEVFSGQTYILIIKTEDNITFLIALFYCMYRSWFLKIWVVRHPHYIWISVVKCTTLDLGLEQHFLQLIKR